MSEQIEGTESDAVLDLVVVGAGFGGIAQAYEARERGLRFRVFESAAGVGGVWHWNRYPGARCDTESVDYSFSFSDELQQEWTWSERYAMQPEIEAYLNFAVDKFDLRDDITLNTRVESAVWDEDATVWHVGLSTGESVSASFVVWAVGPLHERNIPKFDGAADFKGLAFHTQEWPSGLDLTGKKVAVIGTGSSGIQAIPHIAEVAEHLYVFQRTANHCVPAQQGALSGDEIARIKADYPDYRRRLAESHLGLILPGTGRNAMEDDEAQRAVEYEKNWGHGGFAFLATYNDISVSAEANSTAAGFVAAKIRDMVGDADVASLLTPRSGVYLGIKRIAIDNEYYKTFNRDNVTLLDAKESPITTFTESGIETTAGHYDVDVIVYATGFDALAGSFRNIAITGRDGRRLSDVWAGGPITYLGLGVPGFPNMLMVAGPGSPNVLSNVPALDELHAAWIAELVDWAKTSDIATLEPTEEAAVGWTNELFMEADKTLFTKLDTWYNGANVEGKPKVFASWVAGMLGYRQRLKATAEDGYRGFATSATPHPAATATL